MKTKNRALRLAELAIVASLALASAAQAYLIDTDGNGHGLHWNQFPVTYYLVTGNVPHGADGEQAVHASFQAWQDASSAIRYSFAGHVANGVQANDGKNIVYWVQQGWPYDPALAAITFRYFSMSDGHILDADIVFDGENYSWTVGGSRYDIQNSATHEVGHFTGLGHSTDSSATMFASTTSRETAKRSLADDDLTAVDVLYGGVTAVTSTSNKQVIGSTSSGAGGSGGGCSLSGSGGGPAGPADLGVIVLLLAALALRRPRAKRSR